MRTPLIRHWLLRIWVVLWLVLVWLLLWGSASLANMLSGLTLALLITVLLPLPSVPVQGRVHLPSLLWLALCVMWWLVKSSMQVVWLAIRPGSPPAAAVLPAKLDLKTDFVLALAVNIMNLTPGTIVLEIDQARRLLYVHVLDVSTQRSVDRFYRQTARLQHMLVTIFERDSEWHPAATGSEEAS